MSEIVEIWKYPLALMDVQEVVVPVGARFLSAVIQGEVPVVYYLVDPEEFRRQSDYFKVVGTGHQKMASVMTGWGFVATLSQIGGVLMWHIFRKEGR